MYKNTLAKDETGFAHLLAIALIVMVVGVIGGSYVLVSKNGKQHNDATTAATSSTVEATLPDDLSDLKTVEDVRQIVTADDSGQPVTGVDLEQQDGKTVYVASLANGKTVLVDAKTGKIISHDAKKIAAATANDDSSDPLPAQLATPISLDKARELALAQNPKGTIERIQLKNQVGVLVYSVHFRKGDKVDINATTGDATRVKVNSADNKSDSSTSGTTTTPPPASTNTKSSTSGSGKTGSNSGSSTTTSGSSHSESESETETEHSSTNTTTSGTTSDDSGSHSGSNSGSGGHGSDD